MDIPNTSLENWINELRPYQRESINKLLESNDPIEVAKIWATAKGADDTIQFGGDQTKVNFWENLLLEFNKFICDNNEYCNEKKDFALEGNIPRNLLISSISALIGAKIGVAAALIAPSIAILLFTVGSMSKNAYCRTYYQQEK